MIDFSALARGIRVLERKYDISLTKTYKPVQEMGAENTSAPTDKPSNKIADKVNLSDEARNEFASEKAKAIDIEKLALDIKSQLHDYDYAKANAAPINTYNRYDQSLIDKVIATRMATELSAQLEPDKGSGWLLYGAVGLNHEKIAVEIDSLKNQISEQMSALDVDRNNTFSLAQNDVGEIIVTGENAAEAAKTQEKLNSSEHFKETFHLLKTAENAHDVNDNGQNYALKRFTMDVSQDALTTEVTILKPGPYGKELTNRIQQISDTEMYLLARNGISAQVVRYEYG